MESGVYSRTRAYRLIYSGGMFIFKRNLNPASVAFAEDARRQGCRRRRYFKSLPTPSRLQAG